MSGFYALFFRVIGLGFLLGTFTLLSDSEASQYSASLLPVISIAALFPAFVLWGSQVAINNKFAGRQQSVQWVFTATILQLINDRFFWMRAAFGALAVCLHKGDVGAVGALSGVFIGALYIIAYCAQSLARKAMFSLYFFLAPNAVFFIGVLLVWQTSSFFAFVYPGAVTALLIFFIFFKTSNYMSEADRFSTTDLWGGLPPAINSIVLWLLPLLLASSLPLSEQVRFMLAIRMASLCNILVGLINQMSVSKVVSSWNVRDSDGLLASYKYTLLQGLGVSVVTSFLIFCVCFFQPQIWFSIPTVQEFLPLGAAFVLSVAVGPVGVYMTYCNMKIPLSLMLLISLLPALFVAMLFELKFSDAQIIFGGYVMASNAICALYFFSKFQRMPNNII